MYGDAICGRVIHLLNHVHLTTNCGGDGKWMVSVNVSPTERKPMFYLIFLGRPMWLNELLLDSDGSRLPALGVTKPPPSTAIGIINSLGLFLIGCALLDVTDWVCDVISVSESFVDWRDREPDLRTKNEFEQSRGRGGMNLMFEMFVYLNVFPDDCLLTKPGRWIGIMSSCCGSRLVARFCNDSGLYGVECSCMGADRRSGTICCISVWNRIGGGWFC